MLEDVPGILKNLQQSREHLRGAHLGRVFICYHTANTGLSKIYFLQESCKIILQANAFFVQDLARFFQYKHFSCQILARKKFFEVNHANHDINNIFFYLKTAKLTTLVKQIA